MIRRDQLEKAAGTRNSYAAINALRDAFHLREWIWHTRATESALRGLHNARVSIIDWNARPRVFAQAPADDDDGGPDYAIEREEQEQGEEGVG
jgi:hypothetical protein